METKRMLYPAMALFLSFALVAPVLAASPDRLIPEMAVGYSDQEPKTTVVSEASNQIRVSSALGMRVIGPEGRELGEIAHLFVNRERGVVEIATIEGDSGPATISWDALEFTGRPTAHFDTRLRMPAIESGSSVPERVKERPKTIAVDREVLGRRIVSSTGTGLGTAADAVVEFGSGDLVALLVDTASLFRPGVDVRAVPWSYVDLSNARSDGAIVLRLSEKEVEQAPIVATKAPEPTYPVHDSNFPNPTGDQPTLDMGGTSEIAPSIRRR